MWESQGFKTAPGQRNLMLKYFWWVMFSSGFCNPASRQFVFGDHSGGTPIRTENTPILNKSMPPKNGVLIEFRHFMYVWSMDCIEFRVTCSTTLCVHALWKGVECCKASDTMNSSSSSRHSRHYPGNHSSFYD